MSVVCPLIEQEIESIDCIENSDAVDRKTQERVYSGKVQKESGRRRMIKYTKGELDQIAEDYLKEQKQQYAAHQAEKYDRLAKYSLD